MKKLTLIILSLLYSSLLSFGQEAIYTIVENDTVTIWHIEALRNCASTYEMQFEFDGNLINWYQVDIDPSVAYCICNFDLNTELTNLTPGYYEVDVYSVNDDIYANDTTFWGSTSFTILYGDGMPQLLSSYQSMCYDPAAIERYGENKSFSIYPIPAKDYIIVEKSYHYSNIQITDMLGNQVLAISCHESKTNIDISELLPGVYFLNIISINDRLTKRFIKL